MLAAILYLAAQDQMPAHGKVHFDNASAQPADEHLKEGRKLMAASNYEAAIDSFTQSIYFSRNHYNPEAYKWLGLCYKATRQYGKAVQALQTHLAQVTERAPDVHIDLAECYIEMSEFDKARLEIDKAFVDQTLDGGTWRQRYAMGELYERMDDPAQAFGCYIQAHKDKPNDTASWMALARVCVKMKNFNEAIENYRGILEAPGVHGIDYEQLYYNMGQCFFQKGDHQSALDRWRMALDYNPDSYDCHLALATLFDQEKHLSSAVKEYQAALRTMPKNVDQRQTINRRLQWLEQQMAPKEVIPVTKPSPLMRQQAAVESNSNAGNTQLQPAVPKDSGF